MLESAENGSLERSGGATLLNLSSAERLSADLRERLASRASRFALRDGLDDGSRGRGISRLPASPRRMHARARRGCPCRPARTLHEPNEVCRAHGTGILVMRMIQQIEDPPTSSGRGPLWRRLRTKLTHELVLGSNIERRGDCGTAGEVLEPYDVQSILCVPYYEAELRAAIMAKAITRAPLTIYIMDDNAIHARGIRGRLWKRRFPSPISGW